LKPKSERRQWDVGDPFSDYKENVYDEAVFYGSLMAVIGFWICFFVVILGTLFGV